MTLAILGAGAFGTALACVWGAEGTPVTLVARDGAEEMERLRVNGRRLPGVELPSTVTVTNDMEDARSADVLALVVPAQQARAALEDLRPRGTVVVCAKGIERGGGGGLMSSLPARRLAVLSGPGFANEIARGLPTAMTLAATSDALALAKALSRPSFRLYSSDDMDGVAAGGALKNVGALAVGMAEGLDLGASAKAALVTRFHAEMTRLGTALGGRAETFAGLSGMGDLVLTCGPGSRNFTYGMALARGEDLADRPLAEGVATADVASRLARERGIEAPVVEAVAAILRGSLGPAEAIEKLMTRPIRAEGE